LISLRICLVFGPDIVLNERAQYLALFGRAENSKHLAGRKDVGTIRVVENLIMMHYRHDRSPRPTADIRLSDGLAN
jgi:hypothetical protein